MQACYSQALPIYLDHTADERPRRAEPFLQGLGPVGVVGYGCLQAWVARAPSLQTVGYAWYVTALRFLRSSRLPHAGQCVIHSV